MNDDPSSAESSLPTPEFDEQWAPSEEYKQLKRAVNEYIEQSRRELEWMGLKGALTAIVGERYRSLFLRKYGLDAPAETACLRRLITNDPECPHDLDAETTVEGPPHTPPIIDDLATQSYRNHTATLWLADGKPAVYSLFINPAQVRRGWPPEQPYTWLELFEFAKRWELEARIHPISWNLIGASHHILLIDPQHLWGPVVD